MRNFEIRLLVLGFDENFDFRGKNSNSKKTFWIQKTNLNLVLWILVYDDILKMNIANVIDRKSIFSKNDHS